MSYYILSIAEHSHDTVAPFSLNLFKLLVSYDISKLFQDRIGL